MSMFATLNRFISRLDGAGPLESAGQQQQQGYGEQQGGLLDGAGLSSGAGLGGGGVPHNAYGFQVLRNANAGVPLEPWFDFVIGINGRLIDSADGGLFAAEVRNCAGASVELGVWSAKGQRTKSLYVAVPADAPSLGLALQWTPLAAAEDVWHILDVAPNSPADLAGLLPYGDYIIGSPEGVVRGEAGLGELVEHFLNRSLRLYVYNHEYNVTRLVTIEPSKSWGGGGALGCVLGFGALHRIPAPLDEPPQGPGETLFENSPRDSVDVSAQAQGDAGVGPQYLVPADMSFTAPPNGPGGPGGASTSAQGPAGPASGKGGGQERRKGRHNKAADGGGGDMDAYFAEEEAKSRQFETGADGSTAGKDDRTGTSPKPGSGGSGGGSVLPPPPKAGSKPPPSASPSPAPAD